MIVQVAGTSGSGKSHLFRAFLAWAKKHGKVTEKFVEGRKAPIGYLVEGVSDRSIYVVGGYDVPTGGCDTIHNITTLFNTIEEQYVKRHHVLYEGLFVMNQTRGPRLATKVGGRLVVVQLTTPLAVCIASINARRAERGAGALASKKNTVDNYRRAINYCSHMRDAGAQVMKASREEALPLILDLLGVS